MRSRCSLISVLAVVLAPGWAIAQHGGHGGHGSGMHVPAPAPSVRTGKVKGKLVEFSDYQLTVEHERKGRIVAAQFVLEPKTKVKGELKPGSEVVVKYREDVQGQVASDIEVKPAKTKGKSRT